MSDQNKITIKNRKETNLLPFICEAWATNQLIYKDLDALYAKDKLKFYESAKINEYYNHQIAHEGSIKQEIYFKKALGIILNQEGFGHEIYKLTNKGWKYVVAYLDNHDVIRFSDFVMRLVKKFNGIQNIGDDYLNSCFLMLHQMAMMNEKEIDTKDDWFNRYLYGVHARLEHYNNSDARISLNKASREEFKNIKELKQKIYNKFGKFHSLSDMLVKSDKYEELEKYITATEFIFDFEKISLVSISNEIKLSEKDVDEVLYVYILAYKDNIDLVDAAKFLNTMIIIKAFSKAYKLAKKHYFENSSDTMLVKINKIENELKSNESNLKNLQDKVEFLDQENSKLERENKRLLEALHEAEKNKNELNGLREYIFNLDKGEDPAPNTQKNYGELKNIKGIMVGGTAVTYENIKDNFNKLIYISPDSLNFDKNIINDVDVVFIFVKYLSHSLYYKIMSNINNKKIIYINNQNKEIILDEIMLNLK